MEPKRKNAAWNWLRPRTKVRRRQLGFALHVAEGRPGVPERLTDAHARFEQEARHALRDWLML